MPNGGGEAFQAFSRIDAIAFDKTGTITLGKFQVSDHRIISSVSDVVLWSVISIVEQASTHPIALAMHAFARQRLHAEGLPSSMPKVLNLQEVPGRGMIARLRLQREDQEVLIGNEAMMREKGTDLSEENKQLVKQWQAEGKSVVLVSLQLLSGESPQPNATSNPRKHQGVAMFAVADPLRPEASFVLDQLKSQGIGVYIVSGDSIDTVRAVARQLNLRDDQVVGNTLPQDKKCFVEELQMHSPAGRVQSNKSRLKRKIVAFCGDGVNDVRTAL